MSKVDLVNLKGESQGQQELADKFFAVTVKPELVHQLVTAERANKRNLISAVKTRGMVRGGGKKPWKQKGTGRARVGSIRSPLWRGGGIIFGPSRIRNYSKKVNKSQFRKGLFGVLSEKLAQKKLFVLADFEHNEFKTKDLAAQFTEFRKKFNLGGSSVALVVSKPNTKLSFSARNLPNLDVVQLTALSPYNVLKHDSIVFLKSAVEMFEKHFTKNV